MVNIDHDRLELRPEYIDMHKAKPNTIIRVEIADPCNQSTKPTARSLPFIRKSVSRPPLRPERNHTDEKPFERHSSKVNSRLASPMLSLICIEPFVVF